MVGEQHTEILGPDAVRRSQFMKRIHLIAAMAALILAVAAPVAQAATTTAHHPTQVGVSAIKSDTSAAAYLHGCVYGDGGNVETCAYIYNGGSGNYVTFMDVDGCVLGSGVWIHEEITGPGIPDMNSSTVYRSNGNCDSKGYNVYNYVDEGYYYFTTWRTNSNGTYSEVGQVALYVN
jgi:hypothetical protein